MKIRQVILGILVLILSLSTINAQDGGARVYAGAIMLQNRDNLANPNGTFYSGFQAGLDARLMSGGMSFLVGAKYAKFSMLPNETFVLTGHDENITMISGRGGIDFTIFNITRNIRIRSKVLASIDMVVDTKGNSEPAQDYNLNDGWMGIVSGLGFDFGPVVLDVEYEYGIINAYYRKPDTQFDTFTFTAGFFF